MKPSQLTLASLPAIPAALAALSSSAEAQIVYADLGPASLTIDGSQFTPLYFDLDQSSGSGVFASTTLFEGADFALQFHGDSKNAYYAAKPKIVAVPEGQNGQVLANESGRAMKFGVNALVGPELGIAQSEAFLTYNHDAGSVWTANSHGFLGLILNSGANYGWADVSYNADQTLTLYAFAYDASGAAISTPATLAVPEPSTYAMLAGLLAGSAAIYRRRQQRKSAANTAPAIKLAA